MTEVHPGKGAILNAINQARPGDTLLILPGTYAEYDIPIKKKLTLIGKDFPVVDAVEKGQVFLIGADSVTITGLHLKNTGRSSMTDMAAVNIQQSRSVVVSGNKLTNNTYGVYLQSASACTVSNNTIHAEAKSELTSGNGIHAWKSDNLLIEHNTISGHRDGIYFEFVTASAINHNNTFKNIRYGLHFMFSHDDTYRYNSFTENGSGVAVMYTKNVVMEHNVFDHNWGSASYGILLKDISDSRIAWNSFRRNTIGIYMEGSSRVTVKENGFENNGRAMRVQANCNDNLFEKNNFIANSFDVSTNGTMVLNVFRNNYWDKYEGYDLDKDGIGDIPFYPVSLYSVISEKIPIAMILYRSFLTRLMDEAEKLMPSITPDQLKDDTPVMKKWKL